MARSDERSPAWADVRAFGASGNGTGDDTVAFEAAASTGRPILVRGPGRYRISRTIRLASSIIGEGDPDIVFVGADGSPAKVAFLIDGYDAAVPIVMSGLHVDGGWTGGSAGEWSHVVAVLGSTHVVIERNRLERAYGDAVFVGASPRAPRTPSRNVTIRNNQLLASYRCAVAIVSAADVSIVHNVVQKDNGFVAAIDVEPNNDSANRVSNVRIEDNAFEVKVSPFVNLYSFPQYPETVIDVQIRRNRGHARTFLLKKGDTGSWDGIEITENSYLGSPDGSPGTFASLSQEPNGRATRRVVLRGNEYPRSAPGQTAVVRLQNVQQAEDVPTLKRLPDGSSHETAP
jgi:hypothetical protein